MSFFWKNFWRNTFKGFFYIYLNFKVKIYRLRLKIAENSLIRDLAQFRKIDKRLNEYYKHINPFTLVKYFAMEHSWSDIYSYGETSLIAMHKLGEAANLSEKDHIFELGSGRGRALFYAVEQFGCAGTGIEIIPDFIKRARNIALECGCEHITFIKDSFVNIDYSKATVIYLYGTGMPDVLIEKLSDQLIKTASKDCQIITISYPLSDYRAGSFFIYKTINMDFEWGNATAYFQRVCKK